MKGLYRVRDTDGDDQFDEFTLLKRLNYGYEHSAHSIIPTADGKALYLVSGNFTRTTASRLYRIRFKGEKTPGTPRTLLANRDLRALRHSLENLHVRSRSPMGGMEALERAWPHLSHADRNLCYSARIAIECQDLALWRDRAFTEKDPRSAIYAAIALTRHGDKSLAERLLDQLGTVPFGSLEREDQLALLRAYALCFLRMGPPTAERAASVIARLDAHFPSPDHTVNAELFRVLASLDAPTVVRKTIDLMKATRAETVTTTRKCSGAMSTAGRS